MLGRGAGGERGSGAMIALASVVGLAAVGSVALFAAEGGLRGAAHERSQVIARNAAESGVSVAMDALRSRHDAAARWSALVTPANRGARLSPEVAGNGVPPGRPGNLFSPDHDAWYEVELRNNASDPGFAAGSDRDSRVVIRSTGHGPGGARAVLEVEVSGQGLAGRSARCGGYGQRGLSADGAGRDDCIGAIDSGSTAGFRPEE
jgi:hypothetical protein